MSGIAPVILAMPFCRATDFPITASFALTGRGGGSSHGICRWTSSPRETFNRRGGAHTDVDDKNHTSAHGLSVEPHRTGRAGVTIAGKERQEEQMDTGNRPQTWQRLRIGAMRDGTLKATSVVS